MSDALDAVQPDGGPVSSASDKVMFTNHMPAGPKIVLKTVERTASL